MRTLALALMLSGGMYVSGTIDAQFHPDNVLIPVLLQQPVAGAHGSLWETEGFVYNDSDSDVSLGYGITTTGLAHTFVVPARQTVKLKLNSPNLPVGTEIVPAYLLQYARVHDVHFYLRVRDLSRQASTWGTEIPVVKLRDFATEKIVLLNVPADDRFRRTLRLYTTPAKPAGNLLVSFYGQTSGDLLGQQVVHVGEINPNTTGPLYGERHDDFFPRATEPVRIVIEPMQSIDLFWGFVSVTNNETQHVTLITPQP